MQRLQPVFRPAPHLTHQHDHQLEHLPRRLVHQPWQGLLAGREHAQRVLALSADHQRQAQMGLAPPARRQFVRVRRPLAQALLPHRVAAQPGRVCAGLQLEPFCAHHQLLALRVACWRQYCLASVCYLRDSVFLVYCYRQSFRTFLGIHHRIISHTLVKPLRLGDTPVRQVITTRCCVKPV